MTIEKTIELKKWEKIKEAIDNPSRTVRAKFMFELMEDERKSGMDFFEKYSLEGKIKLAIIKHDFEIGYREPKNKKNKKNKNQNAKKIWAIADDDDDDDD